MIRVCLYRRNVCRLVSDRLCVMRPTINRPLHELAGRAAGCEESGQKLSVAQAREIRGRRRKSLQREVAEKRKEMDCV